MGVRLKRRPYDRVCEEAYYACLNAGNVSWFDRLDLLYGKMTDTAQALINNVEDFYVDLYNCASVCDDLGTQIEIDAELEMFAQWIDIMQWCQAMRYPVRFWTKVFHGWGKK